MKAGRCIISKRCMLQYIPVDIFRTSFKFFMGDKFRKKIEGVKGMKFFVHFTVQTPLHIVFLNNLKIVGPLSKMKPCTRRGPKIGKKTLESCDVQTKTIIKKFQSYKNFDKTANLEFWRLGVL